jgi:ABC-type branched-subunit amino acid transport system ATPase component
MTVLTVRDLQVRRGTTHVVRGVSMEVARGEIVAVMGASGGGKTSVLRAIAGLDPIAAGSIAVDGLQLTAGPLPRGEALRQLHLRVGMVF